MQSETTKKVIKTPQKRENKSEQNMKRGGRKKKKTIKIDN